MFVLFSSLCRPLHYHGEWKLTSAWAISLSWWGNCRSNPPEWNLPEHLPRLGLFHYHDGGTASRTLQNGISQDTYLGLGYFIIMIGELQVEPSRMESPRTLTSAWAISLSWWGNCRSNPPEWMSMEAPRILLAITEHSICQPGLPWKYGKLCLININQKSNIILGGVIL